MPACPSLARFPLNHRTRSSRTLALLLSLASCTLLAAPARKTADRPSQAPVAVEQAPVRVTRHTYPDGRPPAHLGELTLKELGVCLTEFGCTAELKAEWTLRGRETGPARLTEALIRTRVTIEIWTVERSGPVVAAHEETHRLISEHYYAAAETIARDLATSLLGRKVALKGTGRAAQPVLAPLQDEFLDAFLWHTSARCQYAQDRFDVITDHGRNSVDNRTGMRQALAEEAAHWATVKDRPPPRSGPLIHVGPSERRVRNVQRVE